MEEFWPRVSNFNFTRKKCKNGIFLEEDVFVSRFLQKLEGKLGLNGFGIFFLWKSENWMLLCFCSQKIHYHLLMIISLKISQQRRKWDGRREDSLTFWLIPTSILWEDFSSNKPNDDSDKMFPLNFEQNFFVTKFPTRSLRRKKFHLP